MKKVNLTFLLTLPIVFITSGQVSQKSNLELFSNKVPTDSALVFAPGVISTDAFEFAITFSPEMDELFFTRRAPEADNEIYTMKLVDGSWSEPEVAFFKAEEGWDFEPHINPTGDRLYFGSLRALPDSSKSTGLHQWYCERTHSGWDEPMPLGSPFIDKSVIMFLTSAKNGNLYFTTGEKGDKPEDWVIYNSINESGQYRSIKRMGGEINGTGKWIAHSFIAPDESYMIYDFRSESGYGKSDLYISFNKNGSWTEPHNLGPKINTDQTEMCASVSPDGKYLFFHRGNENEGSIYWVKFQPIKAVLEQLQ